MKKVNFGEEVDLSETRKDRLKRYYNQLAVEHKYQDIEDFYVSKKFELAMKGDLDTSDKNMNDLLKSIAQDMGYGQSSKEYVIEDKLPTMGSSSIIGK